MRRRSYAITAIVLLPSLMASVLSAQTQTAAQRAFYLDPLIYPHRYGQLVNGPSKNED